ncbi:hypothetical protein D0B54_22315 [Solimonas sp. K1W22B-7]|nr:hypothetical protein D0B54_22315 [Solimonas sp. K1W22B-7]
MADPGEYTRLGFDPPSRQLGTLTVETESLEPGREQLRVRSSGRVSEPILTVLLEVRQGNTRLIREITSFVDPPASSTAVQPETATVVVAPVAPPPLVQALTLEPELPSLAPARAQRKRRGVESTPAATPAPATEEVMAAPAPPRFQLDPHYSQAGNESSVRVQLAPATTAWLQRQQAGNAQVASARPALAGAAAATLAEVNEDAPVRPAPMLPGHARAAPPPWHTFLILVGVTIGIFIYARRLRQRLMREARATMAFEKAAA